MSSIDLFFYFTLIIEEINFQRFAVLAAKRFFVKKRTGFPALLIFGGEQLAEGDL